MKVTVRIHTPSALEFKKVKISSDGKHLLMSKFSRKKEGWKPEIGSIEVKHKRFGRVAYYADIFPDAEKSWSINYTPEELNMPHWNKHNEEELFVAKVIKAAGEAGQPTKTPTILYVIAILSVVSIIIPIILSGRISFR